MEFMFCRTEVCDPPPEALQMGCDENKALKMPQFTNN